MLRHSNAINGQNMENKLDTHIWLQLACDVLLIQKAREGLKTNLAVPHVRLDPLPEGPRIGYIAKVQEPDLHMPHM